jgi:hypothetical protein
MLHFCWTYKSTLFVRCRSSRFERFAASIKMPRHVVRGVIPSTFFCSQSHLESSCCGLQSIPLYIFVMSGSFPCHVVRHRIVRTNRRSLEVRCISFSHRTIWQQRKKRQLPFRAAYSVGKHAASRGNKCSSVIISAHRSAFFAFRSQKGAVQHPTCGPDLLIC